MELKANSGSPFHWTNITICIIYDINIIYPIYHCAGLQVRAWSVNMCINPHICVCICTHTRTHIYMALMILYLTQCYWNLLKLFSSFCPYTCIGIIELLIVVYFALYLWNVSRAPGTMPVPNSLACKLREIKILTVIDVIKVIRYKHICSQYENNLRLHCSHAQSGYSQPKFYQTLKQHLLFSRRKLSVNIHHVISVTVDVLYQGLMMINFALTSYKILRVI